MDNFAKSFGDAINVIGVDNTNKPIPNTTLEIVTNVLNNLQSNTNQEQYANTNNNHNNTQQPNKPSQVITTNISVFKLIKICGILAITHFILSTDFLKNNITKITNNHLITYAIIIALFIMISFITIKWSI